MERDEGDLRGNPRSELTEVAEIGSQDERSLTLKASAQSEPPVGSDEWFIRQTQGWQNR